MILLVNLMSRAKLINQINAQLHTPILPVERLSEQAIYVYHRETLSFLHSILITHDKDIIITQLGEFIEAPPKCLV